MKPSFSPVPASRARASPSTGMPVKPPERASTRRHVELRRPSVCTCGATDTFHVPAPSPASETESSSDLRCVTGRHVDPLERQRLRVGEDLRVVGRRDVCQSRRPRAAPTPPAFARCCCQAAPAVDISADLIWAPTSPGAAASEQRGCAGDVRRGHRGAGEDGERRAGRQRRGGGEDVEARARRCPASEQKPKSVGPADEKLVMIPLRPVWISWMPLETRIVAWPPFVARYARSVRAVEVGDHPGRNPELDRDRVRLAEAVVDEDDPGRAGARRPPAFDDERADAARDEHDLAVERSLRQRAHAAVRLGEPAQVRVDGLAVGADDRRDVDEGLVGARPRVRELRADRVLDRNRAERSGGPPVTLESAVREDVRVDVAATVIASGAAAGEPTVPSPKSSRSLPAAITGTTPASVTLWIVSNIASFAGSVCGPPPEKLMTFMPSVDGCLERLDDLRRVGLVADRRRDREDAVVADPGLRRDAREVGDRRVVGPGRSVRALVAGGDAGDMRAVRLRRVERARAQLVAHGAREVLRDDHLRRRQLRVRPSGSRRGS